MLFTFPIGFLLDLPPCHFQSLIGSVNFRDIESYPEFAEPEEKILRQKPLCFLSLFTRTIMTGQWAWRTTTLGDAPLDHSPQPAVAPAAHDDKVCFQILGEGHDLLGHTPHPEVGSGHGPAS